MFSACFILAAKIVFHFYLNIAFLESGFLWVSYLFAFVGVNGFQNLCHFFQLIKVDGRTGIPKDVLGKGLTAGALKKLDRETRPDSDESDEDDARFVTPII